MPAPQPTRIQIASYAWPEVTAATDLARLAADTIDLADGDILVITSKVVSKAEGQVAAGARSEAVDRELTRVVARRGQSVIAETRHGLVMAAAGVDSSNVEPGHVVSLPRDPDDSARQLRTRLYDLSRRNVAVVVSDTAGRAWRNGQTDMAVGCAGIVPLVDLSGTLDTFGAVLGVTAPAVADELAAASDLVKGKTSGRPVAVVRGLTSHVLSQGQHGPGAVALIRDPDDDLFALGTREAVVAAALRRDHRAMTHFPRHQETDPEPFHGVRSASPEVRFACTRVLESSSGTDGPGWLVQVDIHADAGRDAWMEAGALRERVEALAVAHRLRRSSGPVPEEHASEWKSLTRTRWSVA